jgi:hypothetical protein
MQMINRIKEPNQQAEEVNVAVTNLKFRFVKFGSGKDINLLGELLTLYIQPTMSFVEYQTVARRAIKKKDTELGKVFPLEILYSI